jgi:hypothetical protein
MQGKVAKERDDCGEVETDRRIILKWYEGVNCVLLVSTGNSGGLL